MAHQPARPLLEQSEAAQADAITLHRILKARIVMYEHDHRRKMSCPAMAQMLSNTLYNKRFFPFYTFNLCAGLDTEGKGCVYTYDAIGSYERVGYSCQVRHALLLSHLCPSPPLHSL